MGAQFVVTPWRDSKELLEVRACLFRKDGDEDRREQAVNKVSRQSISLPSIRPVLDINSHVD
jgi:hypothetical protein